MKMRHDNNNDNDNSTTNITNNPVKILHSQHMSQYCMYAGYKHIGLALNCIQYMQLDLSYRILVHQ